MESIEGKTKIRNNENSAKHTPSNNQLQCCQCHKMFDEASKLKKHIHRSHGKKIHVCPDCGKTFALLHKLKIHSLCHGQFAEFLCALCGKRFKRRDKLQGHIERMHSQEETKAHLSKPKPPRMKRCRFPKLTAEEVAHFAYQCTFCVIGFHRRGILVNHMTRLHPEVSLYSMPQLSSPVMQPRRTFKCRFCDRVYMSNGKRKSHIVSSHPGADLAATSRLKGTQDVGCVEIAPRSCSLCPRQFLTNAKLLQHQRKQHLQLPV